MNLTTVPVILFIVAAIGIFLIAASYIFSQKEEDESQKTGHRTEMGFLALLAINKDLALEYLISGIRARNKIARKWLYDTWKYRVLDFGWRFFESCYLYLILGVALVYAIFYAIYLIITTTGGCVVDSFLRLIRIKKIRRA